MPEPQCDVFVIPGEDRYRYDLAERCPGTDDVVFFKTGHYMCSGHDAISDAGWQLRSRGGKLYGWRSAGNAKGPADQ